MDLDLKMSGYIAAVDDAARGYLAKAKRTHTGRLPEAMEYAMFPGGKRVRPLVLIGCCVGAGGALDDALPFACAIEMIHSYSLIHDDLPCMDNGDMRRGKPSCHIEFGEAMAVLAGDALLNLAYETMLEACVNSQGVAAARHISRGAGADGMVGGQAADMFYLQTQINPEGLLFIHANKTAALFSSAALAGAILGGANQTDAAAYRDAWHDLGVAFQIKDDIDDAAKNEQNSYITVFGPQKARADMTALADKSMATLSTLCGADAFVTGLAARIVKG